MWVRVALPEIAGPITGFTFPLEDVLYVLAPGGLARVALTPAVRVRVVADASTLSAAYGPEGLTWDGGRHMVYDADGGDITLCDLPNGDRIVPDGDGTLLITDSTERDVRQRIDSIRLPAEDSWLYAGFSHDYRWLVAGEPRGVQVFRYVPAAEQGAAADGPGD